MVRRSRRRRKKAQAPAGSSRAKGDIVERIVAAMHAAPNVSVERNVYLHPRDGGGRTREIDVLISTRVAGYPVHIAVECKNKKQRIGVEEIDAFVGKLQDVGIPPSLGVFVSASGYTEGALLRAQEAGIKTLILEDVSKRLSRVVHEAFQSIVYLLLTITNIQVKNDIDGPAQASEILFFRDEEGRVSGSVPDLVWLKWRKREIPDKIGKYQVELTLPDGWRQIVKGRVAKVFQIVVDVLVTGHVITLSGSVTQRRLIDAASGATEKWHMEAKFEVPAGAYPVRTFSNERDLKEFIEKSDAVIKVVGRLRLPRIQWGAMYWPPSQKAIQRLVHFAQQAMKQGKDFDFASQSLMDIEGEDIQAIWEPIIEDYPFAKLLHNGDGA